MTGKQYLFQTKTEQFEGPLDLLLSLIEKERLDITKISLAKITSSYLEAINNIEGSSSDLADFLIVAAKLLYLKSKELIPNAETEEEEQEIADLEERLREYQQYKQAASEFEKMLSAGNRGYEKRSRAEIEPTFTPPEGIDASGLFAIFSEVLNKSSEEEPKETEIKREKQISLPEKREHILKHIRKHGKTSFRKILSSARGKGEVIVTFLAILEMIKQKEVRVEQDGIFADFIISPLSS